MIDYTYKYAGSFRRGFASAIDMLIANTLRMIMFTLLGKLFVEKQLINFKADFQTRFDSTVIGRDPDKIRFLMDHQLFQTALLSILAVFLVGAIYYILLNCSKYRATIGKKLMGLVIVQNNNTRLTFFESLSHYFLSIVPWIFVSYITVYQAIHQINIYKAISENAFNLIFGLITVFWLQIQIFTKKKVTVPDLICQTMVIKL
jgi:uncharacterized RDD family membrane protein YckC